MTPTGGNPNRFPIPTPGFIDAIVGGWDGNLWYSSPAAKKIGVCTVSGSITERDPPRDAELRSIAIGPNNTAWFIESGIASPQIVRMAANGTFTEYQAAENSNPQALAVGVDGNVLFGENDRLGRITPDGKIADFQLGFAPNQIVVGPDGNMWLTGGGANDPNLARVTSDGTITKFPLSAVPGGLTIGPDGNIWFTEPVAAPTQIARFLLP
jgi:virginiamycin B lyase